VESTRGIMEGAKMLEDAERVDAALKVNISEAIEKGTESVLKYLHPDWRDDPHLKETPKRVSRAALELLAVTLCRLRMY